MTMSKEIHPVNETKGHSGEARPVPPSKRFGRFGAIVVIALVGLALVGLVALVKSPPRQVPPTEAPAVPVATLQLHRATVQDTFELPARAEPLLTVDVAAEVPGTIAQLGAASGSVVTKGQLLVKLNSDLIQAELDHAKAQLAFDQAEYQRVSELHSRSFAAEKELDETRMKMELAKATFNTANERLNRTQIYAPIDGVLDDLPQEAGEYVQPGTKVAKLVQVDTVKVVLDVPERDVAYLSVGQEPEILYNHQPLTGKITYISKLSDQQTRTTRVEVMAPNPQLGDERAMRSGQIVRVRLIRREIADAIFVPLEAVIPQEKDWSVYVADGDKAQRRDVKLGIFRGTEVQIVAGLEGNELLIVQGQRYVSPGQAINIQKPQSTVATQRSAEAAVVGAMQP